MSPASASACSLLALSSTTYRAPAACLAALGGWRLRRVDVAFRGGRRRAFGVFVFVVVLHSGRSLALLAKVVDDLLQTLACVGFAFSRGHHATGRVDAKILVQTALLI
jgi:hypothetical protein